MRALKLLLYHITSMALIAIIVSTLTTIGDYILCYFKEGGCGRHNVFQRFLFYASFYFIFFYFTFFFLAQILLSILQIKAKLNTWRMIVIGLIVGVAFSSATDQHIMPLIRHSETKVLYAIALILSLIVFVLVNKKLSALFKLKK